MYCVFEPIGDDYCCAQCAVLVVSHLPAAVNFDALSVACMFSSILLFCLIEYYWMLQSGDHAQ